MLLRETSFAPSSDAAGHRQHVCVTHLLQIVRSQGAAEAAAAIKNNLCAPVAHMLLDVSLQNTATDVHRARGSPRFKFVVFAHIDKVEFFACVLLLADVFNCYLFDSRHDFGDELLESLTVFHDFVRNPR